MDQMRNDKERADRAGAGSMNRAAVVTDDHEAEQPRHGDGKDETGQPAGAEQQNEVKPT